MTTLFVTRNTPDGKSYPACVPVVQATDNEFDAFFAEQLREFLHRHGHAAAHTATTDVLLESVLGLFALPR